MAITAPITVNETRKTLVAIMKGRPRLNAVKPVTACSQTPIAFKLKLTATVVHTIQRIDRELKPLMLLMLLLNCRIAGGRLRSVTAPKRALKTVAPSRRFHIGAARLS